MVCFSFQRVSVASAVVQFILTCTVALVLPAVFYKYLINNAEYDPNVDISHHTTLISRGVAIMSLIAYMIYILYQTVSHDGLLHEIYEADEHKDKDRHEELQKAKLTLTEVVLALLISLACVALLAIFLVQNIEFIVEHGVSDAFVGLILIPLVEKIAGMCIPCPALIDSLTIPQSISWPSMRPMTTRSTWLLPTSWAPLSRRHSSTHLSSFWSAGVLRLR
jgi:calcium/proton exchanger cax